MHLEFGKITEPIQKIESLKLTTFLFNKIRIFNSNNFFLTNTILLDRIKNN